MAKKAYHHYAKLRAEQPLRNPSFETADIIVRVEPSAPRNAEWARSKLALDISLAWDMERRNSIRSAYAKTGLCAAAVIGFQTAAYKVKYKTPEEIRIAEHKADIVSLAAAFKGADAPLPNTSQAVMDLRALPEGLACWTRYTNDPADVGSVHGTLVQKCLADEIAALNTPDDKDLSTAWLLCIVGSSLALYKGADIFWNKIRSHHKQSKAIRNNPLYDGEPLPSLLPQRALPKLER
ncbi:hypothetical protein [Micavibrio aeruginosavorus]|uniref:Uncharacterized protein n=1 Tax=Micavibrio aeruginosavorus EPB TaxID=349215 RepID=M4VEC9_9BACT|nr:hypothetical protein [Micavibrio aeruginosavorus]AGH96850.1 hypothetical protein A11S_12 [Micavibrio aeruginosavorus EPB]